MNCCDTPKIGIKNIQKCPLQSKAIPLHLHKRFKLKKKKKENLTAEDNIRLFISLLPVPQTHSHGGCKQLTKISLRPSYPHPLTQVELYPQ